MGKKSTKATRKFAASGQLQKTIQARRKHRDFKKKVEKRKGSKGKERQIPVGEDEDDDEAGVEEESQKFKGMSVDDFLGGAFMQGDGSDEGSAVGSDEGTEEDEDEDDNRSFASVDDLDDEGEAHLLELSKLAKKDPEFYKYLQENDKELLEFHLNAVSDDEDDDEGEQEEDGDAMQEDMAPVLTKQILRKWQRALLEQRSLRALRKLLIAFRSAVHMNEEDQVFEWTIDSSSVYNKLVTTTLKYTPVVLEHHCPYKTLPSGKFKAPTQTPKWKTLQKLILSYFHNIMHLLTQLTDNEMLRLAILESAKLVPYVTGSRKAVKVYLRTCLDLWSTAEDGVRIAAFVAVRRLALATDASIMDLVLKNTYLTLVRSCKSTSPHTLPSINLMKNSASEIYCLDHATAYQHAFGYIRQLAIHLRNSMKVKSKEAYKQVYNWQYVHCVDFWALVLARACDKETLMERNGEESELKPLIYPLVQVSLGSMKLIRNPRSYPFHLHIVRSLLHLTRHTHTYVPLASYLLPILTSTLSGSSKPKGSTLRPLDFETNIRAPQQYLKTRVYTEGLAEETAFLLGEYLASAPVQGSIAFPEIVVPIVMMLRKAAKGTQWRTKETGVAKALVERVEESARWVEQRRKGVTFAPGRMAEIEAWEGGVNVEESPLGKYVKVQRKAREKRRRLVEKAREGRTKFWKNDLLEAITSCATDHG
ncbi:Noc2-domain-containing protein [Laetiporus sulphureus 93-53]|uniref:Noc2-domain-containing protein n=1 Tax=Laetiporus sulphureus 93-53 TaxID=1314785 RepID=A0A165DMX7_9APHY|nr:Noc2-domain-containing protein [Laetiporus sulphureus 93-53]KZT05233.1 Noc2-domain-containing protein [Laetiporus sulphureus 93-53]